MSGEPSSPDSRAYKPGATDGRLGERRSHILSGMKVNTVLTARDAAKISSEIRRGQVHSWCGLPSCSNKVPWRTLGPGAQPFYCSDEHTIAARNQARSLRTQLQRLENLGHDESLLARKTRLLQIRQLRWQLSRYAGAPEGSTADG